MSNRTIERVLSFGSRLSSAILAVAVLAGSATGQSAQTFSIQVSGLGAIPFGGGLTSVEAGVGWEAQLRVTPSAFSIGAGVEQTFHGVSTVSGRDIELLGGFIEPRYVIDIGSDNLVLYLSARAALSQLKVKQSDFEESGTGVTLNGGGGVLVPLSGRVNLDLGATVGWKDLGIVDLPTGTFDLGTGANVVGRIGLAFGIG